MRYVIFLLSSVFYKSTSSQCFYTSVTTLVKLSQQNARTQRTEMLHQILGYLQT